MEVMIDTAAEGRRGREGRGGERRSGVAGEHKGSGIGRRD